MSPSSTPEASIDTTEVVVAPVVYPSWREFWDIHSFSLPSSPLDAISRLQQNLTHFQLNYLYIIFNITAVLYVAFITTPIVYIFIVLAAYLASCFFYKWYFNPEPYNLERPHAKPSSILLVVYIYVVMATNSLLWLGLPWTFPVCLVVTFATVVCLHGMLRVPIYDDQYQGLLDAQLQSHQPPQVDV